MKVENNLEQPERFLMKPRVDPSNHLSSQVVSSIV